MSDYMATFEEFWRELVTDADGNLDLEKVARELSDYHYLLIEVPKAYDELTGGRISKPNTAAHHVVEVANDVAEVWYAHLLCERADDLESDVQAASALRELAEEWHPGAWGEWRQTKAQRAHIVASGAGDARPEGALAVADEITERTAPHA